MEQQPGSERLQEQLRPWLRDRTERADMATRLANIEENKIDADIVEWAFATVRYAWDSESGRGPQNAQSEAVRLLVRSGFEIVETTWEAILDNRLPVVMALHRLIAEMSDKMIACSVDSVAAGLYLKDNLGWSEASKRIRNRFNDDELKQGQVDWYSGLRSVGPDKGWFHEPAHGGPLLAARFRGDDGQLYGEWPSYDSSYENALQAALTVVKWCESSIIAIDNVARRGNNDRRSARIEATRWLDGMAYTLGRVHMDVLGDDVDS